MNDHKFILKGGTFVYPIIQEYKYLDLRPFSLDIELSDVLTEQKIRVNVSADVEAEAESRLKVFKSLLDK